jgi:hypothetical protein
VSVQNATTITEITSSPFQGCSIIPSSDCAGKTLQRGRSAPSQVKVGRPGRIVGEVHVFTTAYDTIPFAIGVKANSAATSDLQAFLADADDAVNISSIAGVWAWKDDQSPEVRHQERRERDVAARQRRPSRSSIRSLRTFMMQVGTPQSGNIASALAAAPAPITLNAEHDRFTFASGPNGGTSALRRPWDSRCKPGEEFYGGLCYDVPVGYAITVPGFVGKPCASGWRDDGSSAIR